MLAKASALDWLLARKEEMLPGALSCDAVCSMPIMPPEEACSSLAASFSQLLDVLEAMAGVEAIVAELTPDNDEPPAALESIALLLLVSSDDDEGSLKAELVNGNPLAIDEIDMTQLLEIKQSPQRY